MSKYHLIRKIYLYTFSLVGLVLVVIGGVRLVGLGLKTFVFTKADVYYEYPMARLGRVPKPSKEEVDVYQRDQRTANRQREAAESLAMIIVGLPLYLYHWQMVRKEKEDI